MCVSVREQVIKLTMARFWCFHTHTQVFVIRLFLKATALFSFVYLYVHSLLFIAMAVAAAFE